MKRPVISPDQSLTFADYFKLNADIEDVLAYFGYSTTVAPLDLPRVADHLDGVETLTERLQENAVLVNLTNETARREFLIAPVLAEVKHHTQTKIKVEYPLEVSHQLKGNLDYYLRGKNNLLIVEAKNADLKRGTTQLAVELIALDKADETDQNALYGAISVGDVWRFGRLDRIEKHFVEDLNFFAVPRDLLVLMQTLIGILNEQ